jgi:hypothetical protein
VKLTAIADHSADLVLVGGQLLVTTAGAQFDSLAGDAASTVVLNAASLLTVNGTGTIPKEVFDNCDTEWSADHCMDHTAVPGILLTNRPLKKPVPALKNLAAAIRAEYGIGDFPGDAEEQLRAIGYISAPSTH